MHRKLTKNSRIVGGLCALALITVAGAAVLRPRPPQPPNHITSVADLDAYLDALTAFGTPPGLSLAVVKDGRVVYQGGAGLADAPKRIAATPDGLWLVVDDENLYSSGGIPIAGAGQAPDRRPSHEIPAVLQGHLSISAQPADHDSQSPEP